MEIHPECSFQALAGAALPSKHTPDGLRVRRALLRPLFGEVGRRATSRRRRPTTCSMRSRCCGRSSASAAATTSSTATARGTGYGLPMRIIT